MSDQQPPELTEEQLAQLDAELDRIHVDDVVLQTIVSLINLGARKGAVGAPPDAGITPDYEQLRIAIDAAKALVGQMEARHGDKLAPFKDALSQLQMAYAQGATQGAAPPQSSEPAPAAEPSGRLWVPGQ
jgi:hypothetical protein